MDKNGATEDVSEEEKGVAVLRDFREVEDGGCGMVGGQFGPRQRPTLRNSNRMRSSAEHDRQTESDGGAGLELFDGRDWDDEDDDDDENDDEECEDENEEEECEDEDGENSDDEFG